MTSGTEKLQLRLTEAIHALRLVDYLCPGLDDPATGADAINMATAACEYLDSISPDWKVMTEEEACR